MSESLLVVGAGYAGQRVLAQARASGQYHELAGCRSADWNLDVDPADNARPQVRPTQVLYLVPPPTESEDDPRLRRALGGLLSPGHRVRRWVLASTTGVYGDAEGHRVDEDTPVRPLTARARRRLAAESLLQERCAAAHVEWCIVRIPGIYGPGRLPIERLRRGMPLPRFAKDRPGNRIHVEDLASALLLTLRHPAAANTIFNVGDGDATSTAEFQSKLAALTGLMPPPLLPDEEARRQLGADAWSFLTESRQVDTRRIRECLGFRPRYGDCLAGLRASLATNPP